MTPREVLVVMRSSVDRRFDFLDDLTWAAWHAALWGRVEKFPKLDDELPSRQRNRSRQKLTVEQDIARWEAFFRGGKAN